jgi:hypothetical protein
MFIRAAKLFQPLDKSNRIDAKGGLFCRILLNIKERADKRASTPFTACLAAFGWLAKSFGAHFAQRRAQAVP